MAYSVPTLKVEVGLAATPLDDPTGITWTDLSDRVRGFSMKRGRSDQLAQFTTGTASVTLDNEDRELDPQNLHGLVPAAARSVTDGVTTNTDATVTSATAIFRAEDVGKAITGTGIPAGATIATFTSATSVEISANATATATGVTLTIAGGRGLPFCPVRISVDYKGSNYKLMGRAFLGPEGWPGYRSAYGSEATVTLNVVDATGLFAWLGMPSSYWRAIVGQIDPDWWLPGEVALPTDTADGFHVNNASGTGGWATTSAANTRTVTDGVLNTDTSLVSASAAFTNADVGRQVNGTGITVGTTIASVTNATTVVLSQATTATATGVTVLIGTTVASPLTTSVPLSQFDAPPSSQTETYNGYGYTRYELPASSWRQAQFVSLVSDEADVFPAGDVPDVTISFMWLSTRYDDGSLAGSAESDLFRIEGTDVHLRLFIDGLDGGSLNLQILDGSGVELTTITAPVPPTAGATSYGDNWDDSDPHGIVVRVVGGTSVDLFVDSVNVQELVDVPTDAFAGDFIIGEVPGGSTTAIFDEVLLVRRALTDTECTRLATAPSAGATWGRGETLAERLELFYDAAGWTLLASESDEWHPPPFAITDPDDPTLIGVAERGASWPKTLGEAVARVASGVGGDLYCLRNGKVRVRSLLATADATLATEYATAVAHLTDEVSPGGSPSPVRRGPVSFSGTRFDRTVTVAEVTYLAMSVESGNQQAYVDAKWVEATADPYMPRTRSATLDTESSLVAEALALAYLSRYGTPGIEVGTVSLYPTRETDATYGEALMDFIVQDLELEKLVELTDTPPVGAAINAELNVQGEAWRWVGTDLVVTLNLAVS